MNILFLSRWFPFPTNNGSKLRVAGLLRGLSQHHAVTLLSFTDQPDVSPDAPELHSICSEVHVVPWREFDPHSRRARLGLFSLQPRFLLDTRSGEMADLIRRALAGKKYDLIIASQLSMAAYYTCFDGVPAIFEELELGHFHDQPAEAAGMLKRLRLNLTWYKLRIYLARLFDSFRTCTVASEHERRIFIENFPAHKNKIAVLPNCIQYADYQDVKVQQIPNQLVYSGSFRFYANYEAMQWFVKAVYPKVLEQVPDARLLITGDPASLPFPSHANITLAGYVDDIKSVIAASAVSLAPLLSGGGTRLKILEAMALGTPVVATSKGAEGLGAQAGRDILIADDPDAFAECVVEILRNEDFRNHLADNASDFVKRNYDWSVVMPQFMRLVDQAAM
jgi:glycosyltransferase involved in cell wall biosynthesis